MRFEELADTLLQNQTRPLPRAQWPAEILLPTKTAGGLFGASRSMFWETVHQLRKYTDVSADKFPRDHSGSTGWEYEFIVAYVDGEVYFSSPHTSRNYQQVSAGHSLQIETVFDQHSTIVRDKIMLDQKQVGENIYTGRDSIQQRNLQIKQGTMQVGFVCHIHSHPQIQSPNLNKNIYGFYSPQDMESLMRSPLHSLGLVTDRLWLACKTAGSSLPTHRDLHSVTTAEALAPQDLETVAGDIMSRYEFALYTAPFGGKLSRVN